MSLEAIGELAGRHPSTVSYWLRKHGLRAVGSDKHGQRGPLHHDELKRLVDSGATLAEIAMRLDRSVASVRYWLDRHQIRLINSRSPRPRPGNGAKTATFECKQHGLTELALEGRGHYRCKRCRSKAVINRRRTIKEKLVKEAGGACALCGYDRWAGALHFHHRDPNRKELASVGAGTRVPLREAAPRLASASCCVRTAMPR
jgi:hypothetical protein